MVFGANMYLDSELLGIKQASVEIENNGRMTMTKTDNLYATLK